MKKKSLEAVRQRYGYTFVAHWALGLALFFIVPLISSVVYSFSDVSIGAEGVKSDLSGLSHYISILKDDPNYLNNLRDALGSMCYSIPIIVALSLILAVILNQNFKGRTIFRGIFFMPVIITSSVILIHMQSSYVNAPLFMVSSADATATNNSLIDFQTMLSDLQLPQQITLVLSDLLGNIFSLIWNCGVQTILFLAGLQSINVSLYEVSKIEGANKWEEFWFITVPMLKDVLSLVIVYTMIELFTATDNSVMKPAYTLMQEHQVYDRSSAMLWLYFIIIIAIIGLVLALYNRFCVKRWE